MVLKGDQNQRHIMPQIFYFVNKAKVIKEMFYEHLKQKILLNCLFRTEFTQMPDAVKFIIFIAVDK